MEENTNISLRDAIQAGFDRFDADAEGETQATIKFDEDGSLSDGSQDAAADATNEPTSSTATTEQSVSEEPVTPQPNAADNQESMLNTAMQMLKSLREENARLNQMVQQQGAAMQQQSEMAEKAIENTAKSSLPSIDFSQLQYMSDEERNHVMSEWQNAIMDEAVARARAEFAPVKADFEEKSRLAANNNAKNTIFNDPRFSDFAGINDDIERIAQSDVFKNVSPEQKYLYSGLIARGMKHNPSEQIKTEDLINMVMANPDALKAIETKRAQEIRDKNSDLPILAGSSGISNANPVPENRVKSREELESRINKRFGL